MAATKKKLSTEVTEHIARLAHLEITDDEKQLFTTQLNSILGHFEMLAEVDVEGVEPTHHVMELTNVFRPDVPKKGLSQEDALKNANDTVDGYVKAPRIV